MATNSRSRDAIIQGAKIVIAEVGSYESNMLQIASQAEVSKATIYNHFADKDEMLIAIIDSEIDRLYTLARGAENLESALFLLSQAISNDQAIAKMVESDHEDIVHLTTVSDHALWIKVHKFLAEIVGKDESSVGLILRWLLAQFTSPLTEPQSKAQAQRLASALSFAQ